MGRVRLIDIKIKTWFSARLVQLDSSVAPVAGATLSSPFEPCQNQGTKWREKPMSLNGIGMPYDPLVLTVPKPCPRGQGLISKYKLFYSLRNYTAATLQQPTFLPSPRSPRHGADCRGRRDVRPRVEIDDLHKPSARHIAARPKRQRLAYYDAQDRLRRDDKVVGAGALRPRARRQDAMPAAAWPHRVALARILHRGEPGHPLQPSRPVGPLRVMHGCHALPTAKNSSVNLAEKMHKYDNRSWDCEYGVDDARWSRADRGHYRRRSHCHQSRGLRARAGAIASVVRPCAH